MHAQGRARKNPRGIDIRELFTTPPEQERHYFRLPARVAALASAFLLLDRCGRRIDPLIPRAHARGARRAAPSAG